MSDCRAIREKLSAFVDNELPLQERRLIEKHLLHCPSCANEESSLRKIISLMDGMPDERPSQSFKRATLHRVSSWKRCDYVKKHILVPALAVLRSAFFFLLYPGEGVANGGRAILGSYLHSFDDFPPESLSSVYIGLIGESSR